MTNEALSETFRREGTRVLAGLIRVLGDFELAEEALQDACAKALEAWAREGVPARPGAWLTVAARRRAVDLRRRQRASRLSYELPDEAAVDESPLPDELVAFVERGRPPDASSEGAAEERRQG